MGYLAQLKKYKKTTDQQPSKTSRSTLGGFGGTKVSHFPGKKNITKQDCWNAFQIFHPIEVQDAFHNGDECIRKMVMDIINKLTPIEERCNELWREEKWGECLSLICEYKARLKNFIDKLIDYPRGASDS